ncbi:GM22507 [Drosophila sechellia]|uniref:non-specific serine/threonine protein kinase n=1 Tax=Drosophila sechellia TaxID=7238 RepID=B4IKG7_DROSE|nr:GM22507 [Drosophila sechellia]
MPINRRTCVAGYSETADIWSVACLLWELATKTYLFDTQSKRGKDGKDEAHLAKIVETNGELSNRESLRPTKLTNLLIRCKGWTTRKATEFVDFLMPMLNTDPLKRTSARKALGSLYLCNIVVRGIDGYNYYNSERGSRDCTHTKSETYSDEDSSMCSIESSEFSSSEIDYGDDDDSKADDSK